VYWKRMTDFRCGAADIKEKEWLRVLLRVYIGEWERVKKRETKEWMRGNEKDSDWEGRIIELYIITQTPMLQKYCVYNVMTIIYRTAKAMVENYRRQKKKQKIIIIKKREKMTIQYLRVIFVWQSSTVYIPIYVSCPSIDYYINPYCRRVAIVRHV